MKLDPQSPVPLYHQIEEAIRYRIATGQLGGGDCLPPLRRAAEEWGVNLHTVRRAYGELAKAGLVEIRRPYAARVVRQDDRSPARARGLHEFLFETTKQARRRFGLSPAQLSALIGSEAQAAASAIGTATFIECSALQAADYAQQLAARWSVRVEPWSLEREGEPRRGPIVSTYFHFNELRARWPARQVDMHFVPVQLDDSLLIELASRSGGAGRPSVVLVETRRERAAAVMGDLLQVQGIERYRVRRKLVSRPSEGLSVAGSSAILFAPRLWARLTESEREDKRVVQLRYLLDTQTAANLAAKLGWPAAAGQKLQAS